MLSKFKEGARLWTQTNDFTNLLPIGYTVSSPIQPAADTAHKNVLRVTGAHVSLTTGNVTYEVRPETVPA